MPKCLIFFKKKKSELSIQAHIIYNNECELDFDTFNHPVTSEGIKDTKMNMIRDKAKLGQMENSKIIINNSQIHNTRYNNNLIL